MARDVTDREDLLREATALVERVELCAARSLRSSAADADENIVAGFRLGGALSVFFGGDPVYQFNAAGELRRAYCDGLIYKAVRGRLVSLERVRTPHDVQLLRRELSDDEQSAFIARMGEYLRDFAARLNDDAVEIVGQVPPGADVLGRVRTWLGQYNGLPIANAVGVTGN
jgi:hypothetical protein